jgi:hypothetical protein
MGFRKLRIAWSVVWGLITVLLIVLWLRSNYLLDDIYVPLGPSSYLHASSVANHVGIGLGNSSPSGTWFWGTLVVRDWRALVGDTPPEVVNHTIGIDHRTLVMAIWLPALLSCVIAVCPWLPLQFSLRTLLVATTLVAVVLGLIVWLR